MYSSEEKVSLKMPVVFGVNTQGTGTVLGQANSSGAISVGAALYLNTPAYGVNPPTIASFSSRGGTLVNDQQQKQT